MVYFNQRNHQMRLSEQKLNPSLKKEVIKTFAQTISDLKTYEDAIAFLKSFFSESELELYSKRLATAYWLSKNRTYNNIRTNLKVSSATIAEISNMVKKKGLEKALKTIDADEWAEAWTKKIHKITKQIGS